MIPNHVLVVGPPHSGKLRIAQEIGEELESPTINQDSHSGLIFRKKLSTRYFSTNINILVDEYPGARADDVGSDSAKAKALEEWAGEFMSDEMTELRDALDGLIFCLDSNDKLEHLERCLEILESIRNVLTPEDAYAWPGFIVVVVNGLPEEDSCLAIEDLALVRGLECVNLKQSGYNEYNERLGLGRIKELFDSHEWSSTSNEVEEKPSTSNLYEQRKTVQIQSMTEPILAAEEKETNEEQPFELSEILQRLSLEKEKAAGMQNKEQKEAYVRKVIDEIIDYI
ncbi:Increased recombination centers protein 6 [Scheffersomyces spartinae]|uniref:Increased recombination centers protein 6 n=1 Tax=Scheffersomyces spartinae TaxID=45513 RepID=A0A9P7V816_9ASCO|nr:Increased recombination centers protein 6 [Scheffersomyces spartinae]KAG7192980.1 Increased recombination centers protein 6 [Scheffersomyces spartinae]